MKSFFKIELSLLSKYRVSIMGIAAIMIMVFHTSSTSDYEKLGILKMFIGFLNCGVDIFLFLSGIGLYYSFSEDSNILNFYKKRFLNIIPISLIILVPFIFAKWCLGIQSLREAFTESIALGSHNPAWYIVFIIILYFVFPWIYHFLTKGSDNERILRLALTLISVVILCYIWCYFDADSYRKFEISLTRLPSFMLGCWMGDKVKKGRKSSAWILLLIGVIVFRILQKTLPTQLSIVSARFMGSNIGIFICFVTVIILSLVHNTWIGLKLIRLTQFVGKMSLETYLTHNL